MTVPSEQVFTVQIDRAAAKLLRKLDKPVQARLVAALAGLAIEPRPAGVKALTGHPGLLRIRVGDYRIIYTVRDGELVVLVIHLGHRGDVYDTL
ncbi:type II toxin-antitoxin system RelE/ParE family toxin [Micromonospora sp. WMMD1128]|uniref:type II toxin-antitoxin system RelE family toxin n=1 Tax=Micromonospora sp. WMMD1128 TaxID=3015150 RepID=UPI00248B90D5|nr:type II toxin-antitoxin system RelE/ParE family toxin [Micromonospora sp. WMMD1128]WBB75082.1 type II toxin-antitoxin system RelE/ParE family toxin [Micromonospora sp. WMMD1128]